MNHDRDDSLLDSFLDEVLGGQSPPDLAARILAASTAHVGDGDGSDLLDPCLEEVLGGHAPPDLTERILDALTAKPRDAAALSEESIAALCAVENSDPEPPPVLSGAYQVLPLAAGEGPSLVTARPVRDADAAWRRRLQPALA